MPPVFYSHCIVYTNPPFYYAEQFINLDNVINLKLWK